MSAEESKLPEYLHELVRNRCTVLEAENAKLKEKLKHTVSEINFALPKIRRWDTNANSVFYTDLNTAGNILSRILASLPEEQNEYLKSVGQL